MDIHAGIISAIVITILAAILSIRAGILSYQAARKLSFYRLRRQRQFAAGRFILAGIILFALGSWLITSGEETAYQYFPPTVTTTPSPTRTTIPTITLSPTITLTPTITDTPSVSDTPTATSTPFLPPAVEVLFNSDVTPNPDSVFSPLEFSTKYDGVFAVDPATVFSNPITVMYGVYSYDQMLPGSQWTALWFNGNNDLVCYETKPWDGTTGGYGYTDCQLPADEWLPGTYRVMIFVGREWKVIGQFVLQGEAPTATPTPTRTPTPAQ